MCRYVPIHSIRAGASDGVAENMMQKQVLHVQKVLMKFDLQSCVPGCSRGALKAVICALGASFKRSLNKSKQECNKSNNNSSGAEISITEITNWDNKRADYQPQTHCFGVCLDNLSMQNRS